MDLGRAKAFGAFYTGTVVAEFLVRWAVRSPNDKVMDPSFGGGVFLEAAAARIDKLSGTSEQQVYGVELDEEVYARVSQELTNVSPEHLIQADFFALESTSLPKLDAVVGNPPFIRYQSFSGELASLRAKAQGVTLTKLSSSWAAFLIHSAAFLKPGGRLGMVVPAELGHAAYAQPVLDYFTRTFGHVTLLSFKKRLFPDLSQDTLLVLAENKNGASEGLFWRDLDKGEALAQSVDVVLKDVTKLPLEPFRQGQEKLITQLLPPEAKALYAQLSARPQVSSLGTLADVGIGYVTGANSFFHLRPEQTAELGLADRYLKRAVFRSAALSGLSFTEADWNGAVSIKNAGYLLNITDDELSAELKSYLERGEDAGVLGAYKCRVRTPWYRVPHVYTPDALLTYMSGLRPQLVANDAEAVAPNTLHVVRFRPDMSFSARTLAAFWQTSLTSLSVELEGHALGGGMLKLEPGEARRVLLATPEGEFGELETKLDALLRQEKTDEAQTLADRALLQDHLGLSQADCTVLRQSVQLLRDRRYYRGKARATAKAATDKTPASPPLPPPN